MSEQKKLNNDFLVELLKTCFQSDKIMQICRKELKIEYIQDENHSKVIRHLFNLYDLDNTLPTYGQLSQHFNNEIDCITFLSSIKNCRPPENKEKLLEQLEDFVKKTRFHLLFQKSSTLFNQGKFEQAVNYALKESEEIAMYSIKETYYSTVFKDYEKRESQRAEKSLGNDSERNVKKLTFGIHELDDITRGGFDKGTAIGILARSGVGKSTFLKWIGLCNAILGCRVVHFQIEGTEQECLDLYDAAWTNNTLEDIEYGNLNKIQTEKIKLARHNILSQRGEIYVYASEGFDAMTIDEANEICKDITEIYGPIDLIIYDYMEVMGIKGDFGGESGERRRRERLSEKITNTAIALNAGVATALQANDIKIEKWNDPDKVLTRSDISEFKGAIKPFAAFLTLNQTLDEYEEGVMRIYCDKFRKYRSGQVVRIFQDVEKGRFYNANKTLKEFYTKD